MLLIDTNIILRCTLNDHAEHSPKARDILLNNEVLIITQVIAEVIYVLQSVYKSARKEISNILLNLCSMSNVNLENSEIVILAIGEFADTNLDFVDLLLYSHQKFTNRNVITFDKKLNSKLSELHP